jgi:beta-1,2-mannobiose phosphorylase / 1,2-beta-oligomannan phosphorylase
MGIRSLLESLVRPSQSGDGSGIANWKKAAENPVLGRELGTIFDVSVLDEDGRFRMWASWRDRKSIVLFESADGIQWKMGAIALGPNLESGWEEDVNRPSVLKANGRYHMWYTGQTKERSSIGYATSADGVSWIRQSAKPVLSAEMGWEKTGVMCPHVLFDEAAGVFKMWYSGGEQFEPDAIGYATSADGVNWKKSEVNPVFRPEARSRWEKSRVTGMHVMREDDVYYGFYIGFAENFEKSCIGLACSKDGVTNWERFRGNPIIRPGKSVAWDDCNVYKPFVVRRGGKWMLWYNASRRSDRAEQIGLATCDDIQFH